MPLHLENLRMAGTGVALGFLLSARYLRGYREMADKLDHLRDGGILLLVIVTGLSLWQARAPRRSIRSGPTRSMRGYRRRMSASPPLPDQGRLLAPDRTGEPGQGHATA